MVGICKFIVPRLLVLFDTSRRTSYYYSVL